MRNTECFITADCGGSNIVLYALSPDISDRALKSRKYPSVNASLDPEKCGRLIAEALSDFSAECADAGCTRASRLLIGSAGCGNKAVAGNVLRAFVNASCKLPVSENFIDSSTKIAVVSDAELAMNAAFSSSVSGEISRTQSHSAVRGLLVIAGTGSVCFLKLGDSVLRRGGFGPVIGDPGSGLDISLRLIRQIMTAHDESEMYGSSSADPGITSLCDSLLRLFSLDSASEIPAFAASASRSAVAKGAELVIRSAECGNPTAAGILRESVSTLADFAASLIVYAFKKSAVTQPHIPMTVSLHGGLFTGSEYFVGLFRASVLEKLKAEFADKVEFTPLHDISRAVCRFDFK